MFKTLDFNKVVEEQIKNASVLLVDDEQDILDMLGYNLEREGINVLYAKNGLDALELAISNKPELIVLDIMMPLMDGVETCKKIKENPEFHKTMIAFLTARSEEYSEIACLEAGADDFIKKPVRPRLFISHVKALLRRFYLLNSPINDEIITIGDFRLDFNTFQLFKNNIEITLTKKEFDLISLLMGRPEKVYLREEIYRKVWGNEVLVGERTIDVHISKLREKIGSQHIMTVKKVGYRFHV